MQTYRVTLGVTNLDKKIHNIKALRFIVPGLGLTEAKNIVEGADTANFGEGRIKVVLTSDHIARCIWLNTVPADHPQRELRGYMWVENLHPIEPTVPEYTDLSNIIGSN